MTSSFALMQPTFAPWIGYLLLARQVDTFVFYDTADFSRQSFHQRNRFMCSGDVKWITVSTKSRFMPLNETKVDKAKLESVCHKLRNYYTASITRDMFVELIYEAYSKTSSLAEGNILLISKIFELLHIDCEMSLASSYNIASGPIDQIIAIGDQGKFDKYISPSGSLAYMGDTDHKNLLKSFKYGCQFIDLTSSLKPSSFFASEPPMSCLHYFLTFGIDATREAFEKLEI